MRTKRVSTGWGKWKISPYGLSLTEANSSRSPVDEIWSELYLIKRDWGFLRKF